MRVMYSNNKGFTLVELMIVVAIIGILAAIVIQSFLKYQAKAKQDEAKVNLKGVYAAQLSYFAEADRYGDFSEIGFSVDASSARYSYDIGGTNTGIGSNCSVRGTVAANQFTINACGNIDGDTTIDFWSIDEANVLKNTINDVNN